MNIEELIEIYAPINSATKRKDFQKDILNTYNNLSIRELNQLIYHNEKSYAEAKNRVSVNDVTETLDRVHIQMLNEVLNSLYLVRENWIESMTESIEKVRHLREVDPGAQDIVVQAMLSKLNETKEIHHIRILR